MDRFALLVVLRAKPGKEREVEEFLIAARPIVLDEVGTVSWYAVNFDNGKYGIFDTFADERGRNAHLNGQVANLLFAKAGEFFAEPPEVEMLEILASKGLGS
jgi:quinol monooxygenase YgiN